MSSNKTTNYNLHSWLPEDDFLRTEMNENFAAIDAAIKSGADALNALVVTGSYVGNNRANRKLELGFTPRAVLVFNHDGSTRNYYGNDGGLALTDQPVEYSAGAPVVTITEGGFLVYYGRAGNSTITSNEENTTYHFLALR